MLCTPIGKIGIHRINNNSSVLDLKICAQLTYARMSQKFRALGIKKFNFCSKNFLKIYTIYVFERARQAVHLKP